MKKFIFCMVLAVMAALSASADVTVTDWNLPYAKPQDYQLTETGPASFDIDFVNEFAQSKPNFWVTGQTVNNWLYDPNEPFTLTIGGFENGGLTYRDNTTLFFTVQDEIFNGLTYGVPFNGPGVYTFTPADILPDYGYGDTPTTVGVITFSGLEYGDIVVNPGASGSVAFTLGAPDPEEETVVPEPATYAYAAMGLVSLMGMKRRIRK